VVVFDDVHVMCDDVRVVLCAGPTRGYDCGKGLVARPPSLLRVRGNRLNS